MTTTKNTAPLAMTDEQIIEVAIKAGITSTSTNEGRVKFARAIMALLAAQPSQAQAGVAVCPKYDPAIQPGSPEFDGAEAYQAHLEAMYPEENATPPASPVASHNEREGLTTEQIDAIREQFHNGDMPSRGLVQRVATLVRETGCASSVLKEIDTAAQIGLMAHGPAGMRESLETIRALLAARTGGDRG